MNYRVDTLSDTELERIEKRANALDVEVAYVLAVKCHHPNLSTFDVALKVTNLLSMPSAISEAVVDRILNAWRDVAVETQRGEAA